MAPDTNATEPGPSLGHRTFARRQLYRTARLRASRRSTNTTIDDALANAQAVPATGFELAVLADANPCLASAAPLSTSAVGRGRLEGHGTLSRADTLGRRLSATRRSWNGARRYRRCKLHGGNTPTQLERARRELALREFAVMGG